MLRNDGPRVIEAERPATQTNVRTELARIGRQWLVSITRLVELSAELDQSGEWALDGSPTCAHWIASVLDIEVSTAREWLRIGRALHDLAGGDVERARAEYQALSLEIDAPTQMKTRVAQTLGISRPTLYRKLKLYGLDR